MTGERADSGASRPGTCTRLRQQGQCGGGGGGGGRRRHAPPGSHGEGAGGGPAGGGVVPITQVHPGAGAALRTNEANGHPPCTLALGDILPVG